MFAAGCISLCSIVNGEGYSYGGVLKWVVGAAFLDECRWFRVLYVRTPQTNYTTIICVVYERIKMCLINNIY